MKKLPILGLFLAFTFLIGVFALSPSFSEHTQNVGSNPLYSSQVCVGVDRTDGSYNDLGCYDDILTEQGTQFLISQLTKNVVTNAGLDASRDVLGAGSTVYGAFDYIALGNGTAPVATDTTLDAEITASGLTRAQGTYYTNPTTGNWTIGHTFTSGADNILVNTTALFNQTSGGTMFAGNSFTSATLQTNDQITLNITVSASSA